MRKLLVIILVCASVSGVKAQTFAEWFKQKKTQRKYLIQQVATLQVYIGYLQKGYSIAKSGLNTISSIKNGEFNLHNTFFNSLQNVNPNITGYGKITEMIALQSKILQTYSKTIRQAKECSFFNTAEISYVVRVFSRLMDDCIVVIDELITVSTAGKLEMKDDERLKRINELYQDMLDKYTFTQSFSNETMLLAAARKKEQNDVQTSRSVNGIPPTPEGGFRKPKKITSMKRILFTLLIAFAGLLSNTKASAQAFEIEQLLLNVEKLAQFKQILADLKSGYQIVSTGYSTIKNISQGNFNLHKTFLDGLLQVSPAVKKYKRVADIISYQVILIKEYKNAYNRFKKDNNFSLKELDYLGRVYNNLFTQSLRNLDDLTTVITADKLRMSDDERLKAIDDIFGDIQDKVMFLRQFNNNTTILALQRAKEKNDATAIRNIYGVNN